MKTDPNPVMSFSFTSRIIAWFSGLFLAIGATLFILGYFGLPQIGLGGLRLHWLTEAKHYLDFAADHQATLITQGVRSLRGNILFVTESPTLTRQLAKQDPEAQTSLIHLFGRLERAYPGRFEHLRILDPVDGLIRASTLPGEVGQPYQDRGLLDQAHPAELGELILELPGTGTGGRPMLGVVRPILAPDAENNPSTQVVGVLVATLESRSLLEGEASDEATLPPHTGTLLLYDAAGRLLAHSDREDADWAALAPMGPTTRGDAGTLPMTDARGEEWLVANRALDCGGSPGWTLVYAIDKSNVLAGLNSDFGRLVWAGLVLTLGALLLISLAARRLTRPLRTLVGVAEQLRAGDLSARLQPAPGDCRETRIMVDAFNRMADRIQGAQQALLTQVAERTAALSASEERYRLAMEVTSEGLWDSNLVTGAEVVNDHWFRMLGYAPGEVATTFDLWKSHLHPEDAPRVLRLLDDYLAGRSSIHESEHRIVTRTGDIRWHRSIGKAVAWNGAGVAVRMVGTTLDITAKRELEEQLRAAKEAAEATNLAKSDFLAHMSHEIRTPLNAMLGLTQVLEQAPLTPDQRDMVQQIRTAGRSLLGLLNDILDLSKIEASQLHLDPRPFALDPLLERIEVMQGTAARGKRLQLRIQAIATGVGALIGDPLRLEQILVNLISNAIKFTDQGEIVVRVEPLLLTAEQARLRFTVSDTGIGIAPEILPRLFIPFTQADGSITRRFGGTGLGLSICKRLVELLGGEIGVESQVGAGSRFWFELPFARTAHLEAPTLPDPVGTLPVGARLAGRHFLVVDDSRMNLEVIKRMLALEGASATLVADGQQALDRLRSQPRGFDAVLMDVQMPVLDGLSATRAIRGELKLTDLPVIAVTAGVLREEQQRTREAGCNDLLPKPVELEELVAVLTAWVRPAPALVMATPCPSPPEAELAALPAREIIPLIPGIDPERLALLAGGDAAFFRRLLRGFVADVTGVPREIRADLAQGAHDAAANHLHRLRGAAANLGALELADSARQLEDILREDNALSPAVGDRFAQFTERLSALLQAAAPWLATAPPPPPTTEAPAPLDKVKVAELRTALSTHRSRQARHLFAELEASLIQAHGTHTVATMAQAMDGLRFDEALKTLDEAAHA
jgi:PAS domain S-box-containing protein